MVIIPCHVPIFDLVPICRNRLGLLPLGGEIPDYPISEREKHNCLLDLVPGPALIVVQLHLNGDDCPPGRVIFHPIAERIGLRVQAVQEGHRLSQDHFVQGYIRVSL